MLDNSGTDVVYRFTAAHTAQVAWSIRIALAGQLGQSGQKYGPHSLWPSKLGSIWENLMNVVGCWYLYGNITVRGIPHQRSYSVSDDTNQATGQYGEVST